MANENLYGDVSNLLSRMESSLYRAGKSLVTEEGEVIEPDKPADKKIIKDVAYSVSKNDINEFNDFIDMQKDLVNYPPDLVDDRYNPCIRAGIILGDVYADLKLLRNLQENPDRDISNETLWDFVTDLRYDMNDFWSLLKKCRLIAPESKE